MSTTCNIANVTKPRWLDDRQQRAWRAYLAVHARLNARMHSELQRDSGLSLSDFAVLANLTDEPAGRVRVGELAGALQWEKSRLSHHLARMQRRQLVARQDCPQDARGTFIVITSQGRRAIEQAAPHHVNTVRELVFDQLTDEQVDELSTISEKLLARFDEDE